MLVPLRRGVYVPCTHPLGVPMTGNGIRCPQFCDGSKRSWRHSPGQRGSAHSTTSTDLPIAIVPEALCIGDGLAVQLPKIVESGVLLRIDIAKHQCQCTSPHKPRFIRLLYNASTGSCRNLNIPCTIDILVTQARQYRHQVKLVDMSHVDVETLPS